MADNEIEQGLEGVAAAAGEVADSAAADGPGNGGGGFSYMPSGW